MKRCTLQFALIFVAGMICGCKTVSTFFGGAEKLGQDLITLHTVSVYESPAARSRKVEYAPGKIVYVGNSAILSSANITVIEPYSIDGGMMGLRFQLDDHGRFLWTQISAVHQGDFLAMLIDHQFRCFVRVGRQSSLGTFAVDGPFAKEEAERIEANAARLYKRLHGS